MAHSKSNEGHANIGSSLHRKGSILLDLAFGTHMAIHANYEIIGQYSMPNVTSVYLLLFAKMSVLDDFRVRRIHQTQLGGCHSGVGNPLLPRVVLHFLQSNSECLCPPRTCQSSTKSTSTNAPPRSYRHPFL